MLGLPWLCRLVVASADFCDGHSDEPDRALFRNDEISDLQACLREHKADLPGAPRATPRQPANIQSTATPGTQILVHVFGEPIRAEHVKVVKLFVEETYVVKAWYMPGWGYETYNRDEFQKFWEDRKRENDVPGVDLSHVPSTYL